MCYTMIIIANNNLKSCFKHVKKKSIQKSYEYNGLEKLFLIFITLYVHIYNIHI